jgi:hypothetical protein
MTNSSICKTDDWTASLGSYALGWGIPIAAIIAAGFTEASLRMAVWTAALAWMGTMCLVNARRCGRTHCRFTGPFYLLMTLPVLMLGFIAPDGAYAWLVLGALILFGGKFIWFATERRWGKFS